MSGSGPSDIGTQRRLRALYARSWSPPALQRESGLPFTLTGRALVELDGITPQFARAVRDVYDRRRVPPPRRRRKLPARPRPTLPAEAGRRHRPGMMT
jgi:hypothetical protein